MNALTTTNPNVFNRDGKTYTTSRDVAEFFGKQHKNVTRTIDTLLDQEPNLRGLNFEQASETTFIPNGGFREDRIYEMDRDGFTLLVMGFTGKKALGFKLRYIAAFNEMQKQIEKPPLNCEDDTTFRGHQDDLCFGQSSGYGREKNSYLIIMPVEPHWEPLKLSG